MVRTQREPCSLVVQNLSRIPRTALEIFPFFIHRGLSELHMYLFEGSLRRGMHYDTRISELKVFQRTATHHQSDTTDMERGAGRR